MTERGESKVTPDFNLDNWEKEINGEDHGSGGVSPCESNRWSAPLLVFWRNLILIMQTILIPLVKNENILSPLLVFRPCYRISCCQWLDMNASRFFAGCLHAYGYSLGKRSMVLQVFRGKEFPYVSLQSLLSALDHVS